MDSSKSYHDTRHPVSCDAATELKHGSNHRPQNVLVHVGSPSGSMASETKLGCYWIPVQNCGPATFAFAMVSVSAVTYL